MQSDPEIKEELSVKNAPLPNDHLEYARPTKQTEGNGYIDAFKEEFQK